MIISVTKKCFMKIKKYRKGNVHNSTSIDEPFIEHLKAEEQLSNWYANIVATDSSEVIVYYNDFTGMMLVSTIDEQTMTNSLSENILHHLTILLQQLDGNHHSLDTYITDQQKTILTNATDLKKIGRMSAMTSEALKVIDHYASNGGIEHHVAEINLKLNQFAFKLLEGKTPVDQLLAVLNETPVELEKSVQKAEVHIHLKLDDHQDVVRVVHVPVSMTLEELHIVIQTCFMWSNSHLHLYILQDGTVIQSSETVSDEFAIENDHSKKTIVEQEWTIEKLNQSQNKTFQYVYDLGDDWIHEIRIQRIFEETERYPIECTMMIGHPMPEDIGGLEGYFTLLNILNNPDDEQFEEAVEWKASFDEQKKPYLNLEFINKLLNEKIQ